MINAFGLIHHAIAGFALGFFGIAIICAALDDRPSLRDGIAPADRAALELLIQSSDCAPRDLETRCLDI